MPFISPYNNPKLMLLNDREKYPFILLDELWYDCPLTGEVYKIERHFRTDLVSMPIVLAAVPIIGQTLVIRYFGKGVWLGARESILHDRLRRADENGNFIVPAHVAHKIFREALYEAGYDPVMCEDYYRALMLFNS